MGLRPQRQEVREGLEGDAQAGYAGSREPAAASRGRRPPGRCSARQPRRGVRPEAARVGARLT
eukprot:8931257-Pyramimonas_sp.AAC.1